MVTLRDLVMIHFRDLKTRLRSSSYNTYTGTMINMFDKDKEFFNKEINQITRENIISFKEKCLKIYNPNTVRRIIHLIKKIFVQALELGYINKNVASLVENVIYVKHRTPNIITIEEFNALIEDIQKHSIVDKTDQILYLKLLFQTGLRSGEARALLWKDIDFKNNTLTVNKNLYCITYGNFQIFEPKTSASNRIIHLTEKLIEDLRIFKEVITPYNTPDDYIFSYKKGIPHILEYNKSTLKKSAKRLGLNISHHGLRHSHATMLIQNGIDTNLVKNRLGHANVSTTLEIYNHVKVYNEDSIIKLLDNI